MQSVLVTVDRHEWYAPPQIYTRDDSTGLWISKSAFQIDSILPSSGTNDLEAPAGNTALLVSEVTCRGQRNHDSYQDLINGVSSIKISYKHTSEETHPRNECDFEAKKRQVQDDSSADANNVDDYTLCETRDTQVEASNTMDNAVTGDCPGATATANTSFAERVIEPTLVTCEVTLRVIFFSCIRN